MRVPDWFVPASTELHETVVRRLHEDPRRFYDLNRDGIKYLRNAGLDDAAIESVIGMKLDENDRSSDIDPPSPVR
jgi:hypothetical protein